MSANHTPKRYFYSNSAGVHGPLASAEIRKAAKTGALKRLDYVWLEGSQQKVLATQVPGLTFATDDAKPAAAQTQLPRASTGPARTPLPPASRLSVAKPIPPVVMPVVTQPVVTQPVVTPGVVPQPAAPGRTFQSHPQIREVRPGISTRQLFALYPDRLLYLSQYSLFTKQWILDDDVFELQPDELVSRLNASCVSNQRNDVQRIVVATIPKWIGGNFAPILVESQAKKRLEFRAWHDQLGCLLDWSPQNVWLRRFSWLVLVDIFLAILLGMATVFGALAMFILPRFWLEEAPRWLYVLGCIFGAMWAMLFTISGVSMALAGIYRAVWTRRDTWLSIPLLLTGIAGLLGTFTAVFRASDASGGYGPLLAAGLVSCLLLYFPVRTYLGDRLVLATHEHLSPRPWKLWHRLAPPLRSNVWSVVLKCAGLAVLIAFWSPLSTPIFTWIDEHTANGSSSIQAASIAAFVLTAPGAILLYLGYRLSQVAPLTSQDDQRRPILFLRPFSDDNSTTIQPRGILPTLCGIDRGYRSYGYQASERGKLSMLYLWTAVHPIRVFRLLFNKCVDSAEESLVRFFAQYAPVYAIGKPGELLPTPGAHRLYPEQDWQAVVSDYLDRSQAVIVQPGTSEGVLWELKQIRQRVEHHRILLSLVAFQRDGEGYDRLRQALWESWGTILPRSLPFKRSPCFVWLDKDWQPIVQELSYSLPLTWPFTGNSIDLAYTLQPFIQGMHGGDREPPRRSRWRTGASYYSIFVPTTMLALLVAFMPTFAVQSATAIISSYMTPQEAWDVPESISEPIDSDGSISREETPTQYAGKRIPYTFALSPSWKAEPAVPPCEYLLRKDGGVVEVYTLPGTIARDVYNPSFPESLRTIVQEKVRQSYPLANVEVLDDNWLSINGTQWRGTSMVQRFGVHSETRLSLYSISDSGTVIVHLILPTQPSSLSVRATVLQNLKAPQSIIDKVINKVATSDSSVYKGTKANYSLRLNNAWQEAKVEQPTLQGLSDAARQALGYSDHIFILGESNLATLEIAVTALPAGELFDSRAFTRADCEELLDSRKQFLQSIDNDRVDFQLQDFSVVSRGGDDWLEIRALATTHTTELDEEFLLILRLASVDGNLIVFNGQLEAHHPFLKKFFVESMDGLILNGTQSSPAIKSVP